MKAGRWLSVDRRRGWTAAGLALVALLFLGPSAGALAGEAVPADYRAFFGGDSRLIIWIVAQVHLMFGAFVLGVPIFAS
ncbi:MAG: hypothetical protein AABZ20_09485, partial [candidate division NC10 bacterium]